MFKKIYLILTGILITVVSYAQPGPVIIPQYVKLPVDSVQTKKLISSLNGFLQQSINPTKDNTFSLKDYLPETAALVAEIRGMENAKNPDRKDFYKCYITNIMPLDSTTYIIQLAYMAVDGATPITRISIKLLARRAGDGYLFYSPLKRNTLNWKSKQEGNFTFYYRTSLDTAKAANYAKKAQEFDAKLHAPVYGNQMYFCDDLQQSLEVLGIDYEADYNGLTGADFSAFGNNIELDVMGTGDGDTYAYDIHDLWHDRLHHTIPVTTINKPVDEACAYLYGGSWGISWNDIFKRFKAAMPAHTDWLAAFNENKNFGENQRYHLYVAYVIDALLAQKIEKEKGFAGVMALLSCGKKEDSNDNFFLALHKTIGINRANFNTEVEKLIEGEEVK